MMKLESIENQEELIKYVKNNSQIIITDEISDLTRILFSIPYSYKNNDKFVP